MPMQPSVVAEGLKHRVGSRLRAERGQGWQPRHILTEKDFVHGDFAIRAKPIGGLHMTDGGEAADKIVAVLEGDVEYGHLDDIENVPVGIVDRLGHYFLSYKQLPNESSRRVEITAVHKRADAHEAIRRSLRDYRAEYGEPGERMRELAQLMRH